MTNVASGLVTGSVIVVCAVSYFLGYRTRTRIPIAPPLTMSPPAAPSTTDAPPALTITVKNIPEFTRECSPVVGEEIKVKITTRNVLGDVIHSGEFNQADVKWVFFDRESPADKILDRELLSLPGVQRVCREVDVYLP